MPRAAINPDREIDAGSACIRVEIRVIRVLFVFLRKRQERG
jgi:hypothetical protein